jgi:hypothetical protein
MDWQLIAVAVLVAAAAAYLARQTWRTWRGGKGGCGGGCGKAAPCEDRQTTLIPADQLTLRRPGR